MEKREPLTALRDEALRRLSAWWSPPIGWIDPQLVRFIVRIKEARGKLFFRDPVTKDEDEIDEDLFCRAKSAGLIWVLDGGGWGVGTTILLTRKGTRAVADIQKLKTAR